MEKNDNYTSFNEKNPKDFCSHLVLPEVSITYTNTFSENTMNSFGANLLVHVHNYIIKVLLYSIKLIQSVKLNVHSCAFRQSSCLHVHNIKM